jgi:hypothetical protein
MTRIRHGSSLTLPVPEHPDFVDTSFNVFVSGKAGTSSG